MNLAIGGQLLRIKMFRRERAEQEQRARLAAMQAAMAVVATASGALAAWRVERPRREEALYDALIGRIVRSAEMEGVRIDVVLLRDRERLLEQRLGEAEAAARKAREARAAADAAALHAQRQVGKFEELLEPIRAAALAEAERLADLELEDFATRSETDDTEPGDVWDRAA